MRAFQNVPIPALDEKPQKKRTCQAREQSDFDTPSPFMLYKINIPDSEPIRLPCSLLFQH